MFGWPNNIRFRRDFRRTSRRAGRVRLGPRIRRGLFRATHTVGACSPGTWLPYLTKHRNINGGSSHRSNYIIDFLPLSFLKQRLDRRPTNDNSRGSETSKRLFFVLLGSVYVARLTSEGLGIGNSNGMVRNVLPALLSAKQ